jgi:hypothetical protein
MISLAIRAVPGGIVEVWLRSEVGGWPTLATYNFYPGRLLAAQLSLQGSNTLDLLLLAKRHHDSSKWDAQKKDHYSLKQ